jgi:S1-C subfamily serine protease
MKRTLSPVLLVLIAAACATTTPPASTPAPTVTNPPAAAAATESPVEASAPQDYSVMLERALGAVVTVAIQLSDEWPTVYGMGRRNETDRNNPGMAYARGLDLSPYAGAGSGFLIERGSQRYIVTNQHVIEGADPNQIYAFSINRQRYAMRVRGADTYRDVAVLEFVDPPGAELAAISIHTDSDLRIGMPVFAVGNPLGEFPYTVTSGIIGGLNRTLSGYSAKNGYLQHDATIIWGNSGGPLLGPRGDVVGLNTRIHIVETGAGSMVASQINFALEGQHLARTVDDLVRNGRVVRPFLGIAFQTPVTENEEGDIVDGNVVNIASVLDGSPAATALQGAAGARVIAINGDTVLSLDDVNGVLERTAPGATVRLTLQQGGQTRDVTFTSGTLDDGSAQRLATALMPAVMSTQVLEVTGDDGRPAVRISASPTRKPEAMNVWLLTEDGGGEPSPIPMQRGERLSHAGFATPDGVILWTVRGLRDLAVIGRLVMPGGAFVVVTEDSRGQKRLTEVSTAPMLFL